MPMIVAVLADDKLKQELLTKKIPDDVTVVWADSLRALTVVMADVYIDLLFEPGAERTQHLKKLLPKPVFINAVPWTIKSIGADFIRINAWPGFLQRDITEMVIPDSIKEEQVKDIFDRLKWKYQLVADIPGMITARVLAMIINEAYYTLGAEVSSRHEIDIAMKLGTSYPLGPFEWADKTGVKNIYELLKELSRTDNRYVAAPMLKHEAVGNGQ